MMTERLLQFIWQYQYFNRNDLQTEQGEPLQVVQQGTLNSNQGPDFMSAKIRVAGTVWAGNIELHINTSDWHKHMHEEDVNYRNVVLHVVWNNDQTEGARTGQQIPLLELNTRVSVHLLKRYEELMNNIFFVPCERQLQQVNPLVWVKWKERLLIERLQRKSTHMMELFEKSNHHWEEAFWWIIARNFGVRVNADAFEAVARSIPLNILAKHKNQIHQLEAILFGQAGLLEKRFSEDYPRMLQKEYRYLRKKYRFPKVFVALQFLRMRPSSFPSIRLAQLAVLIQQSTHLFSQIREAGSVDEIRLLLNVTANDYWHYHYRFEETSAFAEKNLGHEMTSNIMINTIAPVLFSYGLYLGERKFQDKAFEWMEEISFEKNKITNAWLKAGATGATAYDSQALIELKTQYCDYKQCLDCAVGNALLKEQ